MSILENAVKHFGESADQTMHSIDVPEWDETIYFKSVSAMNGLQYDKYIKSAQEQNFSALVDVLILRARDKDGLKMFKGPDKKLLMGQVSPDVITRIVTQMTSVDNTDEAEEKKGLMKAV